MSETDRTKKLIEVALPLDEINAACRADKSRKTGTIRNVHKWFAPMPLPAWRALLFAALVDAPDDEQRRMELLDLTKRLIKNGADLPLAVDLDEAKRVLGQQFEGELPPVIDPFCGGGSTLVEAQRLGLRTYGSDLNPVPALISRTLTELLPRLHGGQPTHPEAGSDKPATRGKQSGLWSSERDVYSGLDGLAVDVMAYAEDLSAELWNRVARCYPTPSGETPLAYLWGRTAQCPNPACGIATVLTTNWWLQKKKGKLAWIVPEVRDSQVHFDVVVNMTEGGPPPSPKIGDGVFSCLNCSGTLNGPYLRSEGKAGRLKLRLMAVSYSCKGEKTYRSPRASDVYQQIDGDFSFADVPINIAGQSIRVGLYGIDTWAKLHTPRQLLLLSTAADLVSETFDRIIADGGTTEWGTAVATLLGLAVGRMSQFQSSQVRWFIDPRSGGVQPLPAFARHDLSMQWDFVEPTPQVGAGSLIGAVKSVTAALSQIPRGCGQVVRGDARTTAAGGAGLVATDPPYFDAIGYADLSDYFYIWHRRALRAIHPDLYSTVAAPKLGELTAIQSHHGGSKDKAREYFIQGFATTFSNLQAQLDDRLPMLVVYASKEQKGGRDEETRWSSILTAMLEAGLEITATWPVHGTGLNRMVGIGTNAVATYIVMACRPRSPFATTTSLADFNRSLRRELGPAVRDLQAASILPVDLAQAAMGPGMQIFSRYRAVLDQSGNRVGVEHALRLINAARGEVMDEQVADLDPESQFALRWWESYGWTIQPFDEANKTARPLGISVDDVVRAQVATSHANRVQLIGSTGLNRAWLPDMDVTPTAWEAVHHLADRLIDGGGELEAAQLMAQLGRLQSPTMTLAYRLHDIAAQKARAADQERYNALISSWSELTRLSGDSAVTAEGLF